MKIFALGEGSYSVDATKKFIPFNPETDNFKDRPASLFIHVNPFLVQTDTDLILLDTGLGYKDTRDELFLHQHIRRHKHKEKHRDHTVHGEERSVQLRKIIGSNQRVLVHQQKGHHSNSAQRQLA